MKNKKIYFIDRTPFTTHYNPEDGREITISVGCRGRDTKGNHCTAFNESGGLRLLTEEEVRDTVAKFNSAEGWKQGDVEADGTPILTYAQ
jgi:hypothetical protein